MHSLSSYMLRVTGFRRAFMTNKYFERSRYEGNFAGQQSNSSKAQDTKERANAISFFLPINERFRLTADELCWRIEQRRKDGEWRPIEYHTTLEAAVNSLSERLLRTSDVQCLADALAAVENISRTLTQALAPQYRVELRQSTDEACDNG